MNFPDRPFDLVTMGQLLLRLSPPGNARIARSRVFEKNVGGAELNVAVGASLLGLHTGVISKIPSNENGQFMRGTIRSYGVSDDFFIYDKNPDARLGIYFYEYGAYPRKPEVIYDRRNSSFSPSGWRISIRRYLRAPNASIPPASRWHFLRSFGRQPLKPSDGLRKPVH